MLKTHLSNASKGIFIGLILSIVFSFLNSPSIYMPLSPSSAVGQWMQAHEIHGAPRDALYCLLIWASIGAPSLVLELSFSLQRLEPAPCDPQPLPF